MRSLPSANCLAHVAAQITATLNSHGLLKNGAAQKLTGNASGKQLILRDWPGFSPTEVVCQLTLSPLHHGVIAGCILLNCACNYVLKQPMSTRAQSSTSSSCRDTSLNKECGINSPRLAPAEAVRGSSFPPGTSFPSPVTHQST